ncbi:MAG: flippase-like domain-containing protein, partial [Desulfobacteraceae bacterium]|nr:flippase-like domain-containing protein [Desulfobacteraceae bacterium]
HKKKNTDAASRRGSLIFLAKMIFAAILFWGLFRLGYIQVELFVKLARRPGLIIVLIFLLGVAFPICALRWHLLLKTQGIFLPFSRIFKVNYLSTFLGLFLPGVIGGDAIRMALGATLLPKQKMIMALSVFVDRLIGVIGLFSLGIIAVILFLWRNVTVYEMRIFIACIGGIFLIFLTALFVVGIVSIRLRDISRKHHWQKGKFIQRLVANLAESIFLYRDCAWQLVLCYGLSIVVHSSHLMAVFIIAVSMEMGGIDVLTYVLAGIVSFLVNFLPFTPGGLGIGEAAFTKVVGLLVSVDEQMGYGTVLLAFRALNAVLLLPVLLMKLRQDKVGD